MASEFLLQTHCHADSAGHHCQAHVQSLATWGTRRVQSRRHHRLGAVKKLLPSSLTIFGIISPPNMRLMSCRSTVITYQLTAFATIMLRFGHGKGSRAAPRLARPLLRAQLDGAPRSGRSVPAGQRESAHGRGPPMERAFGIFLSASGTCNAMIGVPRRISIAFFILILAVAGRSPPLAPLISR